VSLGTGAAWLKWGRNPQPAQATAQPATIDLSVTDGGIYRVRSVVDGDTIVLENGVHVRYNGINAPEMGHFVKDCDPFGSEATVRNTALVGEKRVRLRLSRDPLDKYGRVCARVFLVPDGEQAPETDVCALLVKEGLAKVMGLGTTGDEYRDLKQIEAEAKQANAGLWSLPERPTPDPAKPYWASGKSKIYHLNTCSVAQSLGARNLHQYAMPDEAEAAGYKPCPRCAGKR
jgi:endonuclease YncB( thermonuclease family)